MAWLDQATLRTLRHLGWRVVSDGEMTTIRCQHRRITLLQSRRFRLEHEPMVALGEPIVHFDAAWHTAAEVLGIDPEILIFDPRVDHLQLAVLQTHHAFHPEAPRGDAGAGRGRALSVGVAHEFVQYHRDAAAHDEGRDAYIFHRPRNGD